MTNKAKDNQQTESADLSERSASVVNQLHLPSLYISGFRGIEELNLPKLAQVTLFAGDNGVGKSTILDAVRLYAGRGNLHAIAQLLDSREEFSQAWEDGKLVNNLSWPALFRNMTRDQDQRLEIGAAPEAEGGRGLVIETVTLDEDSEEVKRRRREAGGSTFGSFFKVVVRFDGEEWRLHHDDLQKAKAMLNVAYEPGRAAIMERREPLPDTKCMSVGPDLPENDQLARYWDEVALSTFEDIMVNILRTVVGEDLERVGVVGSGYGPLQDIGGRVMARLKGDRRERMPLKSLGDGAIRLFGLALALTNSIDGFLLVDEAENGIHYSHHEELWRMIIGAAVDYNIQVLATTHSFDCIAGFARAANSIPGDNGMLIRLDRDEDGKLSTAAYTEDLLKISQEMGIEVR